MILLAPTGLYESILPTSPSDPTSVVYTISGNQPPRDESVYQRLPPGVQLYRRGPLLFSQAVRRAVIGDLVYTSKTASPTKATTGSQLFAYGQVLDFTDDVSDTAAAGTTDTITTKHNSNYIDLSVLGLDDSDQDVIASLAVVAQQSILDQIGALQKLLNTLAADIVGLQGQINEATKVYSGLTTIAKTGTSIGQLGSRVQATLNSLNSQLSAATTQYNAIPEQISALRDSLANLTSLVK
jgi:hypothetical protein